ncbi:MAG: RagB/SusD family nutrient uptake outer membrane protein [Prolixibacteraceae bacterium]|nr:RagB/SusD family nutrient uptake outer membrane protein [Prolixibacteraceae bacterium]
MKRTHIKSVIGTALIALFLVACSDILEEQPRNIYTPDYFKTKNGINGAVTSFYSHLRYIYGQAYFYSHCQTGTDEATYAQSADNNFKDHDLSGVGSLDASSSRSDVIWGESFTNINTANGVIEFGPEVEGITNDLIAEARFFRAFDYFNLVQTFGGVPLDLGAGELKFNTTTSRVSVRKPVSEVYTKVIFPDLLNAIENLPEKGRVTGGLTKTAARLYLAKSYLTYAWWLENPNNIPTYPEVSRVDPNGHDAKWYYQAAYDMAVFAIDNPGSFSLQPTFYDVNVGKNDRNSEIVLYADHTQASELYNGGSLTYGSGGAPDNFAGWMMQWNYTSITSSKTDWNEAATLVSSVQREAEQHLGRPWTRMCPTIEVITNTFADKTNDSRYDGTFTTVYRGNWKKGGVTNEFLYNANNMKVYNGDAILTFLNEEPSVAIDYSDKPYNSSIKIGVLPGRADYVVSPSGISRRIYPGLWKIGTYRTDNGTGLGSPNAGSTRPYNVAKFSELYFIAAEAAVKGAVTTAGKSARELINVIRARAGVWHWDNNGNVAKDADNSAVMVAATPADITIDYILAERSREYYGEGYRWYDLIRTQKWADYAAKYSICGPNVGDHTPAVVTRDIKPFMYLRPIPKGQILGLEMTDDEKAAYQNPGYN